MIDIIPQQYANNPSARKIILSAYKKAQREGKFVGYHSEHLSELTGIQPSDDREYGEPDLNHNEE